MTSTPLVEPLMPMNNNKRVLRLRPCPELQRTRTEVLRNATAAPTEASTSKILRPLPSHIRSCLANLIQGEKEEAGPTDLSTSMQPLQVRVITHNAAMKETRNSTMGCMKYRHGQLHGRVLGRMCRC